MRCSFVFYGRKDKRTVPASYFISEAASLPKATSFARRANIIAKAVDFRQRLLLHESVKTPVKKMRKTKSMPFRIFQKSYSCVCRKKNMMLTILLFSRILIGFTNWQGLRQTMQIKSRTPYKTVIRKIIEKTKYGEVLQLGR